MKATVSESAFQDGVAQYAQMMGWKVYHPRVARTANGDYRVPVQYDGKGYPDLTMVREGSPVIFAELKSVKGKLTSEQSRWIHALRNASGVDMFVWRPDDWPEIEEVLA